ncbi:hypothetical protein DWB61_16780 [Ancylomarina euxinus]|uniref:Uncharacterized protein n=1 Tax=Ancylomarina euxinus TaxID=2283627 RepID=A0A425XWU2_9BACT|nr:hypothetical protein DWB61_16780 [Ancylomarina euxinus]
MTLIKKITPSSRNGDISALLTLIMKVFAKNDWSADVYLTSIIETTSGTHEKLLRSKRECR